MFALLMAAKSGVGLAPLPVIIGDAEPDLIRLIGPIPNLTTPFYLLMHRDMRRAPRVRAFFDFFVEDLPRLRPIIAGRS
jgi:DNA-binding transcriptional LysR family regulator